MKKLLSIVIALLFLSFLIIGCNDKTAIPDNIITPKETKKEIEKKETQTQIEIKTTPIKIVQKEVIPYFQKPINRSSTTLQKDSTKDFDFNIIKKGFKDNNTLLIVGGIQGDEPGGFMAASLIATHYTITKGSVWVVPNLNFYSILKRDRGPNGDMNRKFASLAKNDPEYEIIQRIKKYITHESVKLVVNLHDGSGFYRPVYEDQLHSPHKWGQCSIIDQENIETKQYNNLENISNQVVSHVNKYLIKDQHKYHLHNTKTAQGDKEMEKTLTFYTINNGKAAFGNEASKSLPTHQRTYYHLLALEKYMDIMNIEYKRNFSLDDKSVKNIIDHDIEISLYNDTIKLPLSQIRSRLNYFPVDIDKKIDFSPSNPLMNIVKKGDYYIIYYGNRRLTTLKADYMPLIQDKKTVKFNIDSEEKEIDFGSVVEVNESFTVSSENNYRVNVIGYTNKKSDIETDIKIVKSDMMKRFSIDKNGSIFRVEFYKKNKFAGMVLVKLKS